MLLQLTLFGSDIVIQIRSELVRSALQDPQSRLRHYRRRL